MNIVIYGKCDFRLYYVQFAKSHICKLHCIEANYQIKVHILVHLFTFDISKDLFLNQCEEKLMSISISGP